MEIARRKTLPHEIPSWVDPQKEIYFVTINCEERFRNQLALPDASVRLFETVRHRQEKFLWWPYLFLLMPDHLHALLSFPPSGKTLKLIISKWKEWTAKELGIVWQRDFFEHRLRHDESQHPAGQNSQQQSRDWRTDGVRHRDGRSERTRRTSQPLNTSGRSRSAPVTPWQNRVKTCLRWSRWG